MDDIDGVSPEVRGGEVRILGSLVAEKLKEGEITRKRH